MEKNKGGRPSKYSKELALYICKEIASGKSLVKILQQEGMPNYQTVLGWLCRDDEPYKGFSGMYARAREDQADFLADEILEIADDSSRDTVKDEDGNYRMDTEWVQRSRLRVDSRKWIASKLKPRKYGEKLDLEHSGNASKPIIIIDAGKNPYGKSD